MQGQLYIYDGAGTTKQHIWVDALCVACGDAVLKVLGVKRKRQRRDPTLDKLAKELEVPCPSTIAGTGYVTSPNDGPADDLSRRYDSLKSLGKELGDIAHPEGEDILTTPWFDSSLPKVERKVTPIVMSGKPTVCKGWPDLPPHHHRSEGDAVTCVEPSEGWPVNDKA